MPHTRSAKKNVRKIAKRRLHNRGIKKAVKTEIKNFLALVKDGSPDDLKKEYNLAAKKLDKAAAKRVIHPNQAARKKSQLARMLNAKSSAGTAAAGS